MKKRLAALNKRADAIGARHDDDAHEVTFRMCDNELLLELIKPAPSDEAVRRWRAIEGRARWLLAEYGRDEALRIAGDPPEGWTRNT